MLPIFMDVSESPSSALCAIIGSYPALEDVLLGCFSLPCNTEIISAVAVPLGNFSFSFIINCFLTTFQSFSNLLLPPKKVFDLQGTAKKTPKKATPMLQTISWPAVRFNGPPSSTFRSFSRAGMTPTKPALSGMEPTATATVWTRTISLMRSACAYHEIRTNETSTIFDRCEWKLEFCCDRFEYGKTNERRRHRHHANLCNSKQSDLLRNPLEIVTVIPYPTGYPPMKRKQSVFLSAPKSRQSVYGNSLCNPKYMLEKHTSVPTSNPTIVARNVNCGTFPRCSMTSRTSSLRVSRGGLSGAVSSSLRRLAIFFSLFLCERKLGVGVEGC